MSCLWPQPPEYREPEQTHPRLWNPDPTNLQILHLQSADKQGFVVDVESEDAGEELIAAFYFNYGVEGRQEGPLVPSRLGPGSQGEKRSITDMAPVTVPPRGTPGPCEPLTLVVTHISNTEPSFALIEDNDDVDKMTWWIDINGTEDSVSKCGGVSP